MQMSGNPLDPSFGEEMRQALSLAEQAEFEAHLRPLVEDGAARVGRSARAYLRAVKPG